MSSPQLTSSVYQSNDLCVETGCNGDYATLAGYNSQPGTFTVGPPVPSQSKVQPVVIIPSYGGVGYCILQNNLPFNQLSSSGYFSINNAYPSYGNSCQSYVSSLTGSG